jgi:hypothetical protein
MLSWTSFPTTPTGSLRAKLGDPGKLRVPRDYKFNGDSKRALAGCIPKIFFLRFVATFFNPKGSQLAASSKKKLFFLLASAKPVP